MWTICMHYAQEPEWRIGSPGTVITHSWMPGTKPGLSARAASALSY